MNRKAFRVLEFDKMIDLLRQEAVSPMAQAAIGEIEPLTEPHRITEMLAETDEAVSVIMHKGTLPLGGLYDVKRSARYAEKGRVLTMRELLQIMSSLRVARQVLEFMRDETLKEIPKLKDYMEVIHEDRRLEDHIDRCILSEEEMADNASPALRDIRRNIAKQQESARSRMNAMISSPANRELLQDAVITLREGRFVIPVKSENRGQVPGIVHDRSSSGSTLFIEPQAVVDINNEIRELQIREQEEIQRILAELSAECGQAVRRIINNQKFLTQLDVIFAKARLSVKYEGVSAKLNEEGIIRIRRAKHPLLDPKKAVPLDLVCGDDFTTLVITGPNTGGKTVTLKTVGLLMLMTQAGMHIPAGAGTTLPVMKKIYADIGDEQSIEQSLSTFSSHMKNIVEITAEADEETLVLIDELGAGTDPTEGAALAVAILEALAARGSLVLATTHYSELKKYAIATDGVENASMEFDVESLSPTYRLTTGTPGRSNAFEISRKLGLDESIIEDARNLIRTEDIEFEEILSAIDRDRIAAKKEHDEAETLRVQMQQKEDEYERRIREAEEKSREKIEKAKKQAFEIVAETKAFAEEVRRELKELEQAGYDDRTKNRQSEIRRRIRKKSEEYRETYTPEIVVNAKPAGRDELKLGDRVNVVSMNKKGTVASLPDSRDQLMVQIGLMKLKVALSDIMKIDEHGVQKSFEKTSYGQMYRQKSMSVHTSLNVIGKNLDEAMAEVDKYLDDAYMSGLNQVSIIHGRGTGALKNGLRQQLLRHHAHVKSFAPGSYDEGGEGVTVVELK